MGQPSGSFQFSVKRSVDLLEKIKRTLSGKGKGPGPVIEVERGLQSLHFLAHDPFDFLGSVGQVLEEALPIFSQAFLAGPTVIVDIFGFQPGSQPFNRVEIGGIGGQKFDVQPILLGLGPCFQPFGFVKGGVITDEDQLVGGHFSFEMAQKASKALCIDPKGSQHAIELTAPHLKSPHQIDPTVPTGVVNLSFLPFQPPTVSQDAFGLNSNLIHTEQSPACLNHAGIQCG